LKAKKESEMLMAMKPKDFASRPLGRLVRAVRFKTYLTVTV
jgi:hypothetical protein